MIKLRDIGIELANKGDYCTAMYFFKKAYDEGDPEALNDIAITYRFMGDYKSTIECLLDSDNKEDPRALCVLAELYENGIGVDADKEKALQLYEKAMKSSFGPAFYKAALLYLEDEENKDNEKKAFEILKKGVLCEDEKTPYNDFYLAKCYMSGYGTKKDSYLAFHYFNMAREGGVGEASYCLGGCYLFGIECEKDVSKAIDLIYESALSGITDAYYDLYDIYWKGEVIKPNKDIALYFLCSGIDKNNPKCHIAYAYINLNGSIGECANIDLARESILEFLKNKDQVDEEAMSYYEMIKVDYKELFNWEAIESNPYQYNNGIDICNLA